MTPNSFINPSKSKSTKTTQTVPGKTRKRKTSHLYQQASLLQTEAATSVLVTHSEKGRNPDDDYT